MIITPNTNLWRVRCVKKSEFSEGLMWRCVGAVRDRGAGSFTVVLDVRPLRGPSVQPRSFPRWWWAVCEDNTAGWPQMRRRTVTLFVPQLHVVVPTGLVQGAAAPFQPFVDGVSSHWHRGVHLREAGLSSGTVVNILNRVVLAIAGCKLQFLTNWSRFRGRRSVSMAIVARHFQDLNPGFVDGKNHAVGPHYSGSGVCSKNTKLVNL